MTKEKPPKEELERLYSDEKLSQKKIAEKCGVTGPTVKHWLKSYDLLIRNKSEVAQLIHGHIKHINPSKEELERLYVEEKLSPEKIADHYNVSSVTILRWLKKYDILIRSNSEAQQVRFGHIKHINPSKEELERLYVDENWSQEKIADHYGVGHTTILRWLKKYELTRPLPNPFGLLEAILEED